MTALSSAALAQRFMGVGMAAPLASEVADSIAPSASYVDNFVYVTGLVSGSASAATANQAIIDAAIAAARAADDGAAQKAIRFPAGDFYHNATIDLEKQFGLSFIGAGLRNTRFFWAGAASGVQMRIKNVRESEIRDFALIGDNTSGSGAGNGTTTGLELDAVTGHLVNVHNDLTRITIDGHAYGIRIGQSNFQTSESTYWNLTIIRCATACVSIEDANAVNHHFYECYFTASPIGASANIAGSGGSFSMFGCGFTSISTVCAHFYPSSRGHTMENCWAESISGLYAKMGTGGSTGLTLTIKEGSVNQTSHPTQYIVEMASSGSLIMIGGKYGSGVGGSPVKIKGSVPNGRRGNLTLDGVLTDGDPLTGTWKISDGPVVLRNMQADFIMDVSRPAQINGVLAAGTRAVPLAIATTSNWAGAAWYKIASGVVLSGGLNSFAGTNKNVQGKTNIRVDVADWGGLTTQGATVSGRDDDATVNTQFQIDVRVTTGFTLTSDLVFRVQFEPELIVH